MYGEEAAELYDILKQFELVRKQSLRQKTLREILKRKKISFYEQKMNSGNSEICNICVPLFDRKIEDSYIVIGAHYDVVDCSSGMNDNLSSVAILMVLICRLLQNKVELPVEFVFFDGEESGRIGSNAYAAKNCSLIKFMINMDVCGVGNQIVFTRKGESEFDKGLFQAMSQYEALMLEALPEGDDWSFTEVGIPNVSIALLPDTDAVRLSKDSNLYKVLHDKELRRKIFSELQVVESIHGGSSDNLEVICFTEMCRVLDCIKLFLQEQNIKIDNDNGKNIIASVRNNVIGKFIF